jgi:intracellular septation protein
MQVLVDFFPIIIFFAAFKLYGIYVATGAVIVAMALQIAFQWLRERKVSKMLLTSGVLVLLFGSATLLLRDPIFIQWKPTIVYALFAAAFLGSRFVGSKTLVERAMGHVMELPARTWRQLNWIWVAHFSVLGAANIYVVYNYSEEIWVDFKLFGTLGLTLLTVVGQAVWIATQSTTETPEEG